VTGESGARVADAYLTRIETAVHALGEFPHRGTRHDELGPGFRTIGFERRVTIVFRVLSVEVEILHVLYGGRDLDSAVDDS
jgi:toxin ParE1/3/4